MITGKIERSANILVMRQRTGSLDVNLWKEARPHRSVYDSEDSGSYSYEETWLERFYAQEENAWFCEISDKYLMSDFNLNGLSNIIEDYDDALAVIRGEADLDEFQPDLEFSVNCLFYLIHQRYILTEEGLRKMYKKYKSGVYGSCPRTHCRKQTVIAAGASSSLGQTRCCVFCPLCNDLYYTKDKTMQEVDGAAFGSTFAPLFFRRFGMVLPEDQELEEPELQVFGFKVHNSKTRRVH